MGIKTGLSTRRVHLFELEDQSWFPKAIRDAGTDFMRVIEEAINPYGPVVPRLERVLTETGSRRILDLCSGGAGPVVAIHSQLAGRGCEVSVTLTDKFPNLAAFEYAKRRSGGQVGFIETSVDAAAVPAGLPGLRTLFSGLHHFRPTAARRILQDAVEQRCPIAVFEMTQRRPVPVLGTLALPLVLLLVTPMIRPFRWSRFFWTYLVPVVPAFVVWDAFVSCLRTYSVPELQELVDGLRQNGYIWEAGLEHSHLADVSYLIGYPGKEGFADAQP